MLTPEVKTNLILKEFGVDRYIKRPSSKKKLTNSYCLYQNGSILTLLNKCIDQLDKDHFEMLNAIVLSTKKATGEFNLISESENFDELKCSWNHPGGTDYHYIWTGEYKEDTSYASLDRWQKNAIEVQS